MRSRHVGIRETNANEPPMTHRNTTRTTSEPELPASAGKSTEVTYLLAVRCPVYRGRDSSLGFRTELENLVGDAKGLCQEDEQSSCCTEDGGGPSGAVDRKSVV